MHQSAGALAGNTALGFKFDVRFDHRRAPVQGPRMTVRRSRTSFSVAVTADVQGRTVASRKKKTRRQIDVGCELRGIELGCHCGSALQKTALPAIVQRPWRSGPAGPGAKNSHAPQ